MENINKEEIFSLNDAVEEAKKCLKCENPQCIKGCPAHVNIPAYLDKVKNLKVIDAYKIITENNLLPELTCRLCYKNNQCEGHCVVKKKDSIGIQIAKVEKLVAEYISERQLFSEINEITEYKKTKVAIIGGGVSGIVAAMYLAKAGCNVTIYEKEEKLGGVVRYEIPGIKFDKSILDEIEEKIKTLKIDVITNTTIGKDLKFLDIKHENDYVLLATGAGIVHNLNIDGELNIINNPINLREKNYLYSTDFLRMYNQNLVVLEGKIVVIGGGNTAIDCALSAKNNFNETSIYYRRTEEKMPSRKDELETAKQANIQFKFCVTPKKVRYEEGDLIVTFIKTKIEKDKYLNEQVVEIPGTEFDEKINHLIIAVGYEANHDIYSKEILNLQLDKHNNIQVNEKMMVYNNTNLYAAGDVVCGPSTIVNAISLGMHAAQNILADMNNAY